MTKRKRMSSLAAEKPLSTLPIIPPAGSDPALPPTTKQLRAKRRNASQPGPPPIMTNPNENANILDGPQALRASPDSDGSPGIAELTRVDTIPGINIKRESEDVPSLVNDGESDSPLSDLSDLDPSPKKQPTTTRADTSSKAQAEDVSVPSGTRATSKQVKKEEHREPQFLDPEADGEEEADEEEIQAALSRPPPVNSDYLPLPWKGRLGYVSAEIGEGSVLVVLICCRLACVLI